MILLLKTKYDAVVWYFFIGKPLFFVKTKANTEISSFTWKIK